MESCYHFHHHHHHRHHHHHHHHQPSFSMFDIISFNVGKVGGFEASPPHPTPRAESGEDLIAWHVGVQVQARFHSVRVQSLCLGPKTISHPTQPHPTPPKWEVPLVERLGVFTCAHWTAGQSKPVKCFEPRSSLQLWTLKTLCGHVKGTVKDIKLPSKWWPVCTRTAPNQLWS